MTTYATPVDDFLFLLHDVLRIERQGLPGLAEFDRDATRSIVEGAGDIHEQFVFPLNGPGDREGARYEEGRVKAPSGWRDAYRRYCVDGWNCTSVSAEFGGMGLPPVIANCVAEIASAASPSFRMYSSTPAVFVPVLADYGPQWLADHAIPRIVSGEWTSTMCLSEAICGTDLRLMRARATPRGDGSYRLSGTKIFISSGDHDLSDNILHFILAKVPDAEGRIVDDLATVHCFLVSKYRIDPETGALDGDNGVSVGSIEKKMGLKANSTCVMHFDDCVAWPLTARIAAPGSPPGMAAMFQIMNHARLSIAIGAIGVASVAAQSAAHYARERIAGRAPGKRIDAERSADPIIAQPDVRRLLLESASFVEGARATIAWASLLQGIAAETEDASEREQADDVLMLFQPVFKAYFSDKATDVSNACLQVFGGHGYVRDHGMEQLVRDCRIYQIYEGANGVQAFDLVARRMRARNRARTDTYFSLVEGFVAAQAHDEAMTPFLDGLRISTDAARRAVTWLDTDAAGDLEAKAAASYDVLTLFGISVVAFNWAKVARTALDCLAGEGADDSFLRRKLVLARVWMEREVPLSHALLTRAAHGSRTLMQLEAALV